MTGDNALRRAEDIGGQELSYAEVEGHCLGNSGRAHPCGGRRRASTPDLAEQEPSGRTIRRPP